jgi:phosphoenolpyruvate carboxykinase (ATP)
MDSFNLGASSITVSRILRNAAPARLYEEALRYEPDTAIASTGALVALSGKKTGRSPKDKRVVENEASVNDIWWGSVNVKLPDSTFVINRERAIDGFAGWDPKYRIKVRIICARAYHALFMWDMLIRPTAEELADFGTPDYTIINAGGFSANAQTAGMSSKTSIALSFERKEMVILGTEYAGEMKKGVFTIMNYLMPKQGVLSMHCSANESKEGTTSLFFGLSGTGKTTLSADPGRLLIGDDEHCWSDDGIFNIEGGCYAKMINLSAEQEPEIWSALKFGSVLENVIYNPQTRVVDFADTRITDNTRGAYPIEFIENAKLPCVGPHPTNVVFLTCDAFGVLPPVARLNPAQAMYHFISGYTAKVAGTEEGVTDPEATFSACFGAPFLVWHPTKYAEMLAEKLRHHNAPTWLVNTGWSGGGHGVGARMKLKYTRAIIDAIHDGSLANAPTETDPVFGLEVPTLCKGVPSEILIPRNTWSDKAAYDRQANKVGALFRKNFEKYADKASAEVLAAAPKGEAVEGLVLKEEG